MMGISSVVQFRGWVFKTSRKTGPYAVRSSSFEVVVVAEMAILRSLGVLNAQRTMLCRPRGLCIHVFCTYAIPAVLSFTEA